jgi:hypothetical protein
MINNAEHYKAVVPSDGLVTVTKEFMSQPDDTSRAPIGSIHIAGAGIFLWNC